MTIRKGDAQVHQPWHFLSALVGICKALTMVSIGVWITTFVIPENKLSQSTINYEYNTTYEFTYNFFLLNADPGVSAEGFAEMAATDRIEQLRFEDRNRVEGYAYWLLLPSIAMWGLFFLIRKDPLLFDNSLLSLPLFVSDRIPYFLVRWKWWTIDESGDVINEGLSRTVRGARRAIAASPSHSRATIKQEDPFREEYDMFIATLREIKSLSHD